MLEEKMRTVEIEELIPYVNNPKKHPEEQVSKIASSIKKFGFKVPMLITEDFEIIAGHGRYKAANKLGLEEVPCIVADDLSEAEIKAFRLADNKVSESDWEADMLAVEMEEIDEMDFDLDMTGFEPDEVDMIFEGDEDTFDEYVNKNLDENEKRAIRESQSEDLPDIDIEGKEEGLRYPITFWFEEEAERDRVKEKFMTDDMGWEEGAEPNTFVLKELVDDGL